MQQQTVKAIREGQDVSSVAVAYGINLRSVFRWLADFANGGRTPCWPSRSRGVRRR